MFKGLKIKIASLLMALLVLAMCSIFLVIQSFWKKDLLNKEVAFLESVIHQWSQNYPEKSEKKPSVSELTNLLQAKGVKICHYTNPADSSQVESLVGKQGLNLTVNRYGQKKSAGLKTTIFREARQSVYLLAVPVATQTGSSSVVTCVIDLDTLYGYLNRVTDAVWVYILINAIILSVIGFFRLVQSVVKPIDQLVSVTDDYILSGDWSQMGQFRSNEFGRLSFAMSSMLQKIDRDKKKMADMIRSLEDANSALKKSQQHMIRTEKMAAMGRLSSGLAHEIGNPLSIISGYLELLGDEQISHEERQEYLNRAVQEMDRINHMIRQMLDCARTSHVEDDNVISAHVVCQEVVEVMNKQKMMKNILISTEYTDDNDGVCLPRNDLYQVLLNCLFNSIDAIKERFEDGHGGGICLKTQKVVNKTGEEAFEIAIEDNGSGVGKEEVEMIFDPFFTTKEVGKGTGLGLSVSYALIENSGGTMNIKSQKDVGTQMIIRLPLCGQEKV